jgi:hypothetical protein
MFRGPRRSIPAAVTALSLLVACTGTGASRSSDVPPSPGKAALVERACDLPRSLLLRMWRGTYPGRSGEIQLVARRFDLVGDWLPHAGPWPHLQRVPLLLYGPGGVPAAGSVARPVTMADVAPTLAEHMGFGFEAPDGQVLEEAVTADADPPRLVLGIVWDGGGMNVLERHPEAWPNVRGLISEGAWFKNATVGSSPSLTAVVHSTLGTGAFPRTHGRVDHWLRLDGRVEETLRTGMADLLVPSLADEWDLANENEAQVAAVAKETWHLGMIGMGARLPGADRDVALIDAGGGWSLPPELREVFSSPAYADEVGPPEELVRRYDLEDGEADREWHGRDDVYADVRFMARQTRVVEELIERDGFGEDDVTDLMFVNYKAIDRVGHTYTLNSPEMDLMLREADRSLGELVRFLDERVGQGEWLLVLTADHGTALDPRTTGSLEIDTGELRADLQRAFDGDGDDRPVVQVVRSTQLWVDEEELRSHGHSIGQVAEFLHRYTVGENARERDALSQEAAADRAFRAVFPTAVLEDLPCLGRPQS